MLVTGTIGKGGRIQYGQGPAGTHLRVDVTDRTIRDESFIAL